MTSTPSARSVTSIRQRLTRRARADSAAAIVGQRQAALEGDGGRGQRVADVVRADEPQRHGRAAPRRVQRRTGPGRARRASTSAARTSASAASPNGEDPGARCATRIAGTSGSSALSTATPVGGQRLDQLALGLRDRLAGAELAEVRAADVEHDADPRAGRCSVR